MKQILLVEDSPQIAELVTLHLTDHGFEVTHKSNGLEGLQEAQQSTYDLLILDIMLPEMDGMEICRTLRLDKHTTPILMLTAKSEELDRVLGLELGADDYLTKPFSVRELIARVKAIFRRIEMHQQPAVPTEKRFQYKQLEILFSKRRVFIQKHPIELTAKEYDLLCLFAENPGRCYSRQQLLDLVWGYQFEGYEHTVNSHINRLRSKIETTPTQPEFIQTVWGVGYRFADLSD